MARKLKVKNGFHSYISIQKYAGKFVPVWVNEQGFNMAFVTNDFNVSPSPLLTFDNDEQKGIEWIKANFAIEEE